MTQKNNETKGGESMADTNSSSAASTPSSAAPSSKIATSMYASSTTPAAPATEPKSTVKTVTLKEGDKLWRVATDAGISLDTLVNINGLKNYSVKPGKVLQLP
ncbi:hypothetical protein DQM16_06530 [Levilactobacillus brevis]|nr:hypothetical protein DQM16_06530 [Levilactobacillus brevis]